MTTELTMLTYSIGLLIVIIAIQAGAGIKAQGLLPLANSRDNLPPPGVFQARAKRCVDNHREGLTVFAPLVLIAALSHISNQATVLGAQLFFIGRVAHAGIYLAGFPLVRPLAYGVSVAGIFMVFAALMGWAG